MDFAKGEMYSQKQIDTQPHTQTQTDRRTYLMKNENVRPLRTKNDLSCKVNDQFIKVVDVLGLENNSHVW